MDMNILASFIFAPKLLAELQTYTEEFKLSTIISILTTPPGKRTQRNLTLLKFLTFGIPFFQKNIADLGNATCMKTCQLLTYEYFLRGDVSGMQFVFKKGDYGDKFYIILNGTVSVLAHPFNNEVTQEVSKLCSGSAFGELALIKSQPRSASIKCIDHCHLMVLSKDDYLKILGAAQGKRLDDQVDFLRSVSLFSAWSKRALEKLSYHFKVKTFVRNQVVYKEGDMSEHFYVIKSGEFEFSKRISRPKEEKYDFSGKNLYKVKGKPKKVDSKVAILGVSEIFGDEELLKRVSRLFTCTCIMNGELLSMNKHDFFAKIKSEDSLKILKDSYALRQDLRFSRINIIESPLVDQDLVEKVDLSLDEKSKLNKRKNLSICKSSNNKLSIFNAEVQLGRRKGRYFNDSPAKQRKSLSPNSKPLNYHRLYLMSFSPMNRNSRYSPEPLTKSLRKRSFPYNPKLTPTDKFKFLLEPYFLFLLNLRTINN